MDLKDRKFSSLFVLGREDVLFEPRWVCRCDCGTIVVTAESRLLNNKVKGCNECVKTGNYAKLTKQQLSERFKAYQRENVCEHECADCGASFQGAPNAQYCNECRVERRRASHRAWAKRNTASNRRDE